MRVIPPLEFSIRQLTPPATEPMTLAEAKNHLRIPDDVTELDTVIALYIASARAYLEATYSTYLVKRTIEILFQNFPRVDTMRMPIWPIQSIDYFRYTGANGTQGSLAVDTQILTRLYKKPPELVLPWAAVWPQIVLTTADPIAVGATVGFVTASSPENLPMPAAALEAMRMLIGHQYFNGSAITLGSLMKSDPIALGVSQFMANVGLY